MYIHQKWHLLLFFFKVWALHALALIADCGGPMFRSYAESTLEQIMSLLLSVPPSNTEIHQCLGKCLAALITSIGPELQGLCTTHVMIFVFYHKTKQSSRYILIHNRTDTEVYEWKIRLIYIYIVATFIDRCVLSIDTSKSIKDLRSEFLLINILYL